MEFEERVSGSVVITFAQALCRLIPPPKFKIPSHNSEYITDDLSFIFSDVKMNRAAEELKFALILNLLSCRPSIDVLRRKIIKTWGLSEVPMINFMTTTNEKLSVCMGM